MVLINSLLNSLIFPITVLSASINSNSESSKLTGQTALYWGQASAQQQNRLRYYCDSDSVDIFLLSFITDFPNSKESTHGYTLNLANACASKTYSSEDSTPNCTQVGDDIKYCQSLGKKVLLSLGGESGDYGFNSDYEAENFADVLWNSFGEGSDYPKDERPFGDAIVDGFDFDLANENQIGYVTLANKLKNLTSSGNQKEFILTSAPQCPFPDKSNSELIDGVELDYLFIQFYNNKCALDQDFNFDTWSEYIQSKNYEKTKLFIGLPATNSSASSGFVDSDAVLEKIEQIWSSDELKKSFGGVMFWDASQAFEDSEAGINSLQDNLVNKVASNFQKDNSSEGSSGTTVSNSPAASNITSAKGKTSDSGVLKPSSSSIFICLALSFFFACFV